MLLRGLSPAAAASAQGAGLTVAPGIKLPLQLCFASCDTGTCSFSIIRRAVPPTPPETLAAAWNVYKDSKPAVAGFAEALRKAGMDVVCE